MSTISIRKARIEDTEAIRDVQYRTWLETYPNETYGITRKDITDFFFEPPEIAAERRARRQQAINTAPRHSWVALDGEKVIGFCIIRKDGQENLIQALYVLPSYQGKGVGKRLMQEVLDWFGPQKEVILHVASYNEKAIAFYHALGFVSCGLLPDIEAPQLPSGARIPALLMKKKSLSG